MELYISPTGDDAFPGTVDQPLKSLDQAFAKLRKTTEQESNTIYLREGTYFLKNTIQVTSSDCEQPLAIQAYNGEKIRISGGRQLECSWQPYKDGIYVTDVEPGLVFTQMFADGKRQVRARYPNKGELRPEHNTQNRAGYYTESEHCRGYTLPLETIDTPKGDPIPDPDSDMTYDCETQKGIIINKDTFSTKHWSKPEEAVIHIFHSGYWGNLQWFIKAVNDDLGEIWFGEGGHQMGAKWTTEGSHISPRSRFYLENIFEELDAPMEWYLDKENAKLYWMPEDGVDPNSAVIEVPQLKTLFELNGSRRESIKNLTFERIQFSMTETTFFEEYEIPSLGDWALHRSGAFRLEGTRNCTIKDCLFSGLGGNAIFVDCFNRDLDITGCTFHDIGDSAVLLVGNHEKTTGTQKHFPYECRVENNHFYDLGIYGKQTAAVYISRAKRITVGHNYIHDLPRAGICIGDGTWGGHIIEYNHIHDSCLETVDHGPFNAWGRDRYWSAIHGQSEMLKTRSIDHGDAKSAAMETVILRHNFFVEEKGWGLDLDDGASNYEIYNNICIGVGMKMREGSYRTVHNNIWVNCASAPQFGVGNEDNHDQYFNNITVMSPAYQKENHDRLFSATGDGNEIYSFTFPPVRSPWLEKADNNCYFNDRGEFVARVREREAKERRDIFLEEWQEMGFDRNSVFADPMFVDPENNDYRVRPESPALKVGFKNFEMGNWGLTPDFPNCW